MKLKLVNSEEQKEIIDRAQNWSGLKNFSSTSTAWAAIAEFLANEKGLTLYIYRVDEEIED